MSDLATTALTVAKMLGRADANGTSILDLETEIKDEIKNAIKYYNRRPLHLIEVRGGTLTTVAGQTWYSSLNVGSSIRDSDGFNLVEVGGVAVIDAVTQINADQILNFYYMRENPGASGLNEPMGEVPYRHFERLFEGSTPQGQPEYFTTFAGQVGIWPTPSGVNTLYWSGAVKPVVPVADTDPSIWFVEANELIEMAACQRVCAKWLRDDNEAAKFKAMEIDAYRQLLAEYGNRSSTGRIKAHE